MGDPLRSRPFGETIIVQSPVVLENIAGFIINSLDNLSSFLENVDCIDNAPVCVGACGTLQPRDMYLNADGTVYLMGPRGVRG